MDRDLLDAEAIARELVPAGSVFAFLASDLGNQKSGPALPLGPD